VRGRVSIIAATVALSCQVAPRADAYVDLASNARGDQVLLDQVLGQHNRPLFATAREPGGSFAALAPISPATDVGQRHAVVDEAGGAVAAWSTLPSEFTPSTPVYVATRPPGGQFGAPRELGTNAGTLILAGNGHGDAIVIWEPDGALPQYSFRPAGGDFGPAIEMPRYLVGAALDDDGSTVFVSYERKGAADARLTATVMSPSGKLGPTQPIAGSKRLTDVHVAGAPNGRILIVARGHTMVAIDRPPGGEFGAVQEVGSVSAANGILDVKVTSSGAAVVSTQPSGAVAVRLPGEPFRNTRSPSPTGEYTSVAIDDAGDAAVAWQTGYGRRFRAAYKAAGERDWTRRLVLAPVLPFSPGTYGPPALALDASGTATAVWEESDGDTVRTITREFRGSSLSPRTEVGSVPAYVAERPPSACRPAGSRMLRGTSRVNVFKRGGMYACLFDRGVPVFLGGGDSSTATPFPSNTMAVAGPLIAYGYSYLERDDEGSLIEVVDLRDPEFGNNRATRMEKSDYGILLASAVRPNGAVAWLSCSGGDYENGSAKDCRRRERVKHVWMLGSRDGGKHRLDSGRTIDPRTFELHRSRLTWRHGGKLRHARLR
jgi:hypothetical protein